MSRSMIGAAIGLAALLAGANAQAGDNACGVRIFDGRADILVGNGDDPSLSVLFSQRDGTFGPIAAFSGARAALAVADLDADGDLDVVSTGPGATTAHWNNCNIPLPPTCDLNGDGLVNSADLALLLANWGTCASLFGCVGDFDHNGVVNGLDLAMLLGQWG